MDANPKLHWMKKSSSDECNGRREVEVPAHDLLNELILMVNRVRMINHLLIDRNVDLHICEHEAKFRPDHYLI